MAHCKNCKKQIDRVADSDICPYCGYKRPLEEDYMTMDITQVIASQEGELAKTKSKKAYLLLCLFLGIFGIHEFYIGKKAKGGKILLISFIVLAILFGTGFLLSYYLFKLNQPILWSLIPLGVYWIIFDIISLLINDKKEDLKDSDGVFLR